MIKNLKCVKQYPPSVWDDLHYTFKTACLQRI